MAVKQYLYDTPGDYTYDASKIGVSGGIVSLKEDLSNVIARYHLNEATGATVLDTSGNGRNGTPINNPASVAGKLNNCLSFNGSNYVNCGDIANFERTDKFSVEFWIKTIIGTTQVICSRVDYGAGKGWQIITNNNRIRVYLMNSTSNRIIVETDSIVNDNLWHHIIVTYDGSSDANGVIIYLDNAVFNTIITNDLSASILNGGNCQIIGGYGTLLEAVQAFTYQFNNIGTKTVRLQVEDNLGEKSEDDLEVDVQQFQVIFNIKDSQGNHLADVNFKPGDGSGYAIKHSPFTYEYNYNASGYDIILDKSGYSIETQNVVSTDHTENFTFISLMDSSDENIRIINEV